jgi:tetratricopeptide (TPR) repeat protein
MNSRWIIGLVLLMSCGCAVNPTERNNAGNNLYSQSDYSAAIKAYQSAQVAAPDDPEAYYNAASAYSRAGEYEKAIEALKQALKTTDPDLTARAQYNLGNVYFEMRRFGDSVMAYQQVLLIQPNDEDTRHNLELAMNQILSTPSPAASSESATEDGGNRGATPTNVPESGQTPTPIGNDAGSQTTIVSPYPDGSDLPPTYSVEDAQRMLDAVQQSQPMFPNQAITGTPNSPKSGKDW